MSEQSRVRAVVRARGDRLLIDFTKDEIAKWHKRCGDFRDSVAEGGLTGGAFAIGTLPGDDGMTPLVCVRGNGFTLEAAVRALVISWVTQSAHEGTPVTLKAISETVALAWKEAGGEA